jgi:hypothetical protein
MTLHDEQLLGVSGRLVRHCILDALDHHNIHEVGAQDVLAEALLLEKREGTQRRGRMAAQTPSVIDAVE